MCLYLLVRFHAYCSLLTFAMSFCLSTSPISYRKLPFHLYFLELTSFILPLTQSHQHNGRKKIIIIISSILLTIRGKDKYLYKCEWFQVLFTCVRFLANFLCRSLIWKFPISGSSIASQLSLNFISLCLLSPSLPSLFSVPCALLSLPFSLFQPATYFR